MPRSKIDDAEGDMAQHVTIRDDKIIVATTDYESLNVYDFTGRKASSSNP